MQCNCAEGLHFSAFHFHTVTRTLVYISSTVLYFNPLQICLAIVPALVGLSSAQAPGDEDVARCIESSTYAHTYPDNWNVLMDSWNYEQLLPGHSGQPIAGAVWTDASCDNRDNAQFPSITPPYVSVHVTHHSTSCMS